MSKLHTFLILSLALTALGQPAHAADPPAEPAAARIQCGSTTQLSWITSQFPPLIWKNAQGPQGYAHVLIEKMAERMGRKVELEFYPWARVLRMVEDGPGCATVPLARTPEREKRFRWLAPLVYTPYVFYGKPGAPIDDLETLRKSRIGVIRASASKAWLVKQGFTQLIETKDHSDLVRMVNNGSIDAMFAFEEAMAGAIEAYDYKMEPLRAGLRLGGANFYFAASLDLSDEEASQWQQAWRELYRDGTLAQLQRQYKIKPDRMPR